MNVARWFGAIAVAATSTTACLLVRDVDMLTRDTPSRDGAADAAVDSFVPDESGADGACPGTGGPLSVPVGDSPYCIDTTEVTVRQYKKFLGEREADTSGQSAACAWNTDFRPSGDALGQPDDVPITFVDWCDAVAFCSWSGKRLCGAIGGGSIEVTDRANAQRSQWFRACSRNGEQEYPYGSVYDGQRCNGEDRDAGLLPVASSRGCEGGYPGTFDLVGNVREWEDACDDNADPAQRECLARGGGWYDVRGTLACENQQLLVVTERNPGLGFRCCSR